MNASIVKQIHEPLVPQVRQILAVKESKRVYKNVKFECNLSQRLRPDK